MPEPQNYKNHTRVDPLWHFFLIPMLLVNIIFAIIAITRHWPDHRHLYSWWAIMGVVLILAVGRARDHSLKVQDRVIRLEERLRLAALLPSTGLAASQVLTTKQLIALRFASDAELPALVQRTLSESLTPKQIKQAIQTWRPDHLRV